MCTLRPASADDADAIHWLVRTGRINPTGLDWRRFVLAVSSSGQVIGCAQVKPHRDGSRELASIVVHPDWGGQGIARALIEHLLAAYPGDLYLMCRSELGLFYEKFGFHIVQPAEMPKYFRRISRLAGVLDRLRSEGVSLLVMQRG
jgi:N-acetylglutamate synthase-like GNAT family acetyltransferase